MRNLLYAFIILAFVSCKKNQDNTHIQKWKLVNMTSAWTGQSQSFNYQQYIILNVANGTYKKERWENDKLTASTLGTYKNSIENNSKVITLKYTDANTVLKESCENDTEVLYMQNNQLIGMWHGCDGPKLTYELEK